MSEKTETRRRDFLAGAGTAAWVVGARIARVAIYPALGIGRVGGSPKWFLAPELPGVPPQNAPITSFADNDGWYDDWCDGPVDATVTLDDGRTLQADGAWVACAGPNFAPEIPPSSTLYDVIASLNWERGWEEIPDHADRGRPGRLGVREPAGRRMSGNHLLHRSGSSATWPRARSGGVAPADRRHPLHLEMDRDRRVRGRAGTRPRKRRVDLARSRRRTRLDRH